MAQKIITPGTWSEYPQIKFYKGETVVGTNHQFSDRHEIRLPENWQHFVTKEKFERIFLHDVKGIPVEYETLAKARQARKLNLAKNDVFTLNETREDTGEKQYTLYLPTDISVVGQEKTVETIFGYYLNDKWKIICPMLCTAWAARDITQEQADAYCKEWNGTHTKKENGIRCEVTYVPARESLAIAPKDKYVYKEIIPFIVPWFYLLKHLEVVHNDYYEKTDRLANKMNDLLSGHRFTHYDIDTLLKHFDIAEKEEA